jgi:predicted ATPase/class 3 adenylate cyclase/DNA-binding winged helix-turn-helix (wHTH) protein
MIYVFGAYEFDTDRRALRRAGIPVRLEPKVFDLLAYLIQHRDHFVSREDLHEQLWPELFVSDSALTYCIAEARKAVGDTGRAQRLIKTVHGRGYCFVAPVEERLPDSAPEEAVPLPAPEPDVPEIAPPQTDLPLLPSAGQGAPRLLPRPIASPPRGWPAPGPLEAERRQLTVLWCRGVASSGGPGSLDAEELHAIIHDVQRVCDQVIERFEGWLAQHFGDGFVVYFGHPRAHEDDARRAVHTALAMVRDVTRLAQEFRHLQGVEFALQVGIHTGMVVISTLGNSDGRGPLALGNTPHVAAQLASLALPNTVVISLDTLQLVEGYFVCAALGTYILDHATDSTVVYQVLQESDAQSRLDVAVATRLTPFVGREHEIAWLRQHWEQSTAGMGQVVIVHGEAGIGKSRLLREFQASLVEEDYARLECRCSSYAQHSALYPIIEQVQRWLHWQPDDDPALKLHKLEQALASAGLALEEEVPLWAALLSLPLAAPYVPLAMPPQQQKQRTFEVLLTWLLRLAEPQPLCLVIEDLHWADASTLEFLDLLVDQVPMARLLVLLACRRDFTPPWSGRSYITRIALSRLTPPQTERMIARVTAGKTLPAEIQQQLIVKTNGMPLFVEEMTKMVLELGLVKEKDGHYESTGPPPTLTIPSTLRDSLMARLDRQGAGKLVAQVGATLGREFSYEVIQAMASLDEAVLQQGLTQLVQAEILYQRGLPPHAQYVFKHALIQETAYQSLLRRTRQQYHQQIAQVLEERFPETCATQPELVAHHYTEAGLSALAVEYWQRAGQRASERSAHVEAIAHVQHGLTLAATLPDSPERLQHELTLYMALGRALMATHGFAATEVEHAYMRARDCARQVGDPEQIFMALRGLWLMYLVRGAVQMAYEQGVHLLHLAQQQLDPLLLIEAHRAVGVSLCFLGEIPDALAHLQQGLALHQDAQHNALTARYVQDPGMVCLAYTAWVLWWRGYPDQALHQIAQALALVQQCQHPFCQAFVLHFAAILQQCRGDAQAVARYAETSLALAQQYGYALFIAMGEIFRGWALAEQQPGDDGIEPIRAGVAAYRATGAELYRPYFLGLLAEVYGRRGRAETGLEVLAEALAQIEATGERLYEAEIYRLQGELLLARSPEQRTAAEACFQHALALARLQQARLLEVRAAMSLSRLWLQQGKRAEARHMLGEVYGWFTEGFDTPDVQAARMLLDALR